MNGAGTREVLHRVRSEARTADPRDLVRAMEGAFRKKDLLTYASAISFQVFFALIPLILFALGLLGLLSLDEAWKQDLAPEVKDRVSPAVFTVINDTVEEIVGAKHLFWVSFGAAIAIWEISGAMRAVMQVFNRIYGVEETRPFWRRMWISLALSAVGGVLLILTFAIARFGPLAVDLLGADGLLVDFVTFVIRWTIALTLMLIVVGILVRYAPDKRRPLHWVSFGALVVVFSWALMSVGFWWYATRVADYASIFGSLATIIVVMTYLYASVIVFLSGVQLDSIVRGGIERRSSG